MNALVRRVRRLEGEQPVTGCAACDGKTIGVVFTATGPDDYAPSATGNAPLPPDCPRCGRRMPKVYVLRDRAAWDAI